MTQIETQKKVKRDVDFVIESMTDRTTSFSGNEITFLPMEGERVCIDGVIGKVKRREFFYGRGTEGFFERVIITIGG